jgi:RNA polymerase sigma-70 factor (ECF subfamily)
MPVMTDPVRGLYDEHADALYAFLLQLVRHEADVKDLLQEVFLKVAREPDKFRNLDNPRGYLLRLAHRQFLDLLRRRKSASHRETTWEQYQPAFFLPGDTAEAREFQAGVIDALGHLPEDQRAVVHLKIWEEKTFVEIAEILGISNNTAASRYRYALDKLEDRLRSLPRIP